MPRIKIRASRPGDAKLFAKLVIESSPMFPDVFGPGIESALMGMFAARRNLFGGRHVSIAEADGAPAGMLLGYTHVIKKREDLRTGLLLARELGPELFLRLPLLLKLSRCAGVVYPGEFFVSNIAIEKTCRGAGAGKGLMLHAEEVAKSQNARMMALEVDCDNPSAMGLYEKLGYAPSARFDININGKPKSFFRMIKTIL